MSYGTKILTSAILTTLVAAPLVAQTIPHWIDRQTHGTARHITPRHHKPGEPPYDQDLSYRQSYRMRRIHVVRHRRHHPWVVHWRRGNMQAQHHG